MVEQPAASSEPVAWRPQFGLTPPVNLVHLLEQQLRDDSIVPSGKAVLLAVSGGLDSMVLLDLVVRLQPTFRWTVHVAHFNHQLRGRASDADENLVRKHCSAKGIPFHSARWTAEEMSGAIRAHGVEMAAREARQSFLAAVARSVQCRHVLLGHHADDQIELFFLRVVRGAGSRGLAGMNGVSRLPGGGSISLVRPLLKFRRHDLEQWARIEKIRFRKDASNKNTRFLRNLIRLKTLPLLEKACGGKLSDRIERTMLLLRDEADCLREQARVFLRSRKLFDPLPVAIQRWVIVLQLEAADANQAFDLVEQLRQDPGRVIAFPGNRRFSRDGSGRLVEHAAVSLQHIEDVVRVHVGAAGTVNFGRITVEWSVQSGGTAPPFRKGREVFDADKIGGEVTLRHWRAGDRFRPIGMKRPVKLQNLFVNAGIPAVERRQLVIAESSQGDIFWTQQLRMSDPFKISSNTRRFLVWKWRLEQ